MILYIWLLALGRSVYHLLFFTHLFIRFSPITTCPFVRLSNCHLLLQPCFYNFYLHFMSNFYFTMSSFCINIYLIYMFKIVYLFFFFFGEKKICAVSVQLIKYLKRKENNFELRHKLWASLIMMQKYSMCGESGFIHWTWNCNYCNPLEYQ